MNVYSVIDASGTWSEIAQTTTVSRLTQAGAKVTSWMSVSAELQKDWRNPTGQGLVVQLVRIPACHAGGRGFESRPDRKKLREIGAFLFICH